MGEIAFQQERTGPVRRLSAWVDVVQVLAVGLMLFLGVGCSSLPEGMAGLKVTPVADPKVGYHPPAADAPSDDFDSSDARQADPYRLIDYRNLGDLVVYLVPADASAAPSAPLSAVVVKVGNAGRSSGSNVDLASVGGTVEIQNNADTPGEFYLRADSGEVTNIGRINANSAKRAFVSKPGLVTLFREKGKDDDLQIVDIFVAPNPWVRQTSSGGSLTFSPIPPGRYEVRVWHPRLPGSVQQVEAVAGQITVVTAKVGVNTLPPIR